METNKPHFFKGNYFFVALLLGSILLLLIFICVATFSGAWPGSGISAQILSALAGAVVTAMITLFLLLGQTANEEKKDRNAKIFEEQLRIYNEFLQKLCSVVSDKSITKDEEIELEFQVAQIAMHTSEEAIVKISKNVSDIIIRIKQGNKLSEDMIVEVLNIADIFHQELYKGENTRKKCNITTYDNVSKDKQSNNVISTSLSPREATIQYFKSIITPQEDIDKYENETSLQTMDNTEPENLNLSDRAKLLKAKIDANGAKQWIYGRTTLVHDFPTDGDTNNNIAVDITPDSSKQEYNVSIFVRTWDPEKIKEIANEIWPGNHFQPWPENEPCRLLYKTISFEDIDKNRKEFIKEIEDILSRVKAYRDKHYSLQ